MKKKVTSSNFVEFRWYQYPFCYLSLVLIVIAFFVNPHDLILQMLANLLSLLHIIICKNNIAGNWYTNKRFFHVTRRVRVVHILEAIFTHIGQSIYNIFLNQILRFTLRFLIKSNVRRSLISGMTHLAMMIITLKCGDTSLFIKCLLMRKLFNKFHRFMPAINFNWIVAILNIILDDIWKFIFHLQLRYLIRFRLLLRWIAS